MLPVLLVECSLDGSPEGSAVGAFSYGSVLETFRWFYGLCEVWDLWFRGFGP